MPLVSLSLSRCEKVTDVAVTAVSGMHALTYLNLYGCRKCTNESVTAVSGMAALTELDLSSCSKITNAALRHLTNLTSTHLPRYELLQNLLQPRRQSCADRSPASSLSPSARRARMRSSSTSLLTPAELTPSIVDTSVTSTWASTNVYPACDRSLSITPSTSTRHASF